MNRFLMLLVVFGVGSLAYYFATEDRRVASNILNAKIPLSVNNLECESWGFTDVLTKCVFVINPKDFESLLEGWKFEEKKVTGKSHKLGGGPKLGEDFDVSFLYLAHPTEFSHGGQVAVLASTDKSKVSIDIYVE